ncbi:MAG: dihydropteroate synthase [Deltaproteobacteria bacterium CG_4_8_14_3_um_filter_51_11]|nr:dihydropteroate synthase [bacterium]OIP37902.1 MAG: dihydropteroate synthase [Desulfobacteraceae bacterium CG2_30_51_40]PIP48001.1 MAG: dihydropteroate synthase [Deltaproteobacteria bacterium CG23_combo_of_CG06-09_8_20_14_all_51_20]PIX18642.1 MAG: dihydropteroate synthase [Deltaproteobacteria bacterium CG_4_8_14_3_um_filter_51_11]PIY25216.1 MAG: dihydropteroate synthase [Deltaproteobacteria bacterium CG_4_10_14_3_um_filter_51_14]PJB35708.1 MAG: dihydropteroate synthase [Deltaproteobacteria 
MSCLLKWQARVLDLSKRTHVMGVLNVTPDSFSDGGRYFSLSKAVEHGILMAEQGADIIDVGGESTRPFSGRIPSSEEIERTIPVIESLAALIDIPISIDTTKADVAAEALRAGASIINDISALRQDQAMASIAAEAGVPVILMHMRGSPEDMQANPTYGDVVGEVISFLQERTAFAVSQGIKKELIVIDPGIGFGKTFDHNLTLIRELRAFKRLGQAILLGTSNKSFIGHILKKGPSERLTGSMATVAAGVMNGADIVRVHNVLEAVETTRIIDAVLRGLN